MTLTGVVRRADHLPPKSPPLSTEDSSVTARQKRHHHKVRTGCLTCKKRRVRCDEGKPICGNCLKLEKVCAYGTPKTWYFEPTNTELVLARALSQMPTHSDIAKDGFSFQFFCENSLPQLCGFNPQIYCSSLEINSALKLDQLGLPVLGVDTTVFDNLWRRLMIKVAHTEPLIWRLLCCYADQQRRGIYDIHLDESVSMIKTYTQAMATLAAAIKAGASPEAVAIASFLIFALERMSRAVGSTEESFTHFEKGSNLLLSLKDNPTVRDYLLPARTQLLNMAAWFRSYHQLAPLPHDDNDDSRDTTVLILPDSFRKSADAKFYFLKICLTRNPCSCSRSRSATEHWSKACTDYTTGLALLKQWSTLITQYFESQKGLNDREARTAFAVRAQSHLVEMAYELSSEPTFDLMQSDTESDRVTCIPDPRVNVDARTDTEHDCVSNSGIYGPCKVCWG